MIIVSFINPWQRDVIDEILTHCGLSQQLSRAPPIPAAAGTWQLRELTERQRLGACRHVAA